MLIILKSILWTTFGVVLYREKVVGSNVARLLGRTLYWVGEPLQIFFLTRNSDFSQVMWLPPMMTLAVLLLGLGVTIFSLEILRQPITAITTKLTPQTQLEGRLLSIGLPVSSSTKKAIYPDVLFQDRSTGSFILASVLANTGFMGLAVVPSLVDSSYWSWIVLYSLAHNILGSYGLGVVIADHYSSTESGRNWIHQLQNLLILPALWAFAYGYFSRDLSFTPLLEKLISQGVLLIIPGAFILIGMRISTLRQWHSLRSGIFPTLFRILIVPGLAGLLLTLFGVHGDSRLVFVLMSSMPTAFSSLILAEEYNLDRQVTASSILLSILALPIVVLLWLTIFK
ncbi:MAG: AEC family transporter [Waterburya sp.]